MEGATGINLEEAFKAMLRHPVMFELISLMLASCAILLLRLVFPNSFVRVLMNFLLLNVFTSHFLLVVGDQVIGLVPALMTERKML